MKIKLYTLHQKFYFGCLIFALILVGCAGPNPNPGERTVDMSWTSENYSRAFALAKEYAEKGEPWAQLRLGIFYTNGWGVKKDSWQSVKWYEMAMQQKGSGDWAEGKIVGATGKSGYFNQNSDALIAEFNLAQLYYEDDMIPQDLAKAYSHINNVIAKSQGKTVFFCCEFQGGLSFKQKQFTELKDKIEAQMN